MMPLVEPKIEEALAVIRMIQSFVEAELVPVEKGRILEKSDGSGPTKMQRETQDRIAQLCEHLQQIIGIFRNSWEALDVDFVRLDRAVAELHNAYLHKNNVAKKLLRNAINFLYRSNTFYDSFSFC